MVKLFVGGLRWEVTEAQLNGFFEQWGCLPDVVKTTILRDAEGISKQFGFLYVPEDRLARALSLHGKALHGQSITVRQAGDYGPNRGRKKR